MPPESVQTPAWLWKKYLIINNSFEKLSYNCRSKLDYCNSLYFNLPKTHKNTLQHIQNSLARTVANTSTPCLKKTVLFLSELRQISTNFDNFWQNHGKEAKIMHGAFIFHLTYFASSHYRVKRRCSKLLGYTTLKVVICNKLSNDLISTQ